MSLQPGARSAPHHPSAPYMMSRPPVPPSTGQGWVIVALFFCWPFALAALPHMLRASRALGANDIGTAAAEGTRARTLGLWGLITGLSLGVLFTIAYLIAVMAIVVPAIGVGADDATPATSSDIGSGPADGTPVRDTWSGDCYRTDGLTDVVARVEVVACSEPHGGEMYSSRSLDYVYREADSPEELPYPGQAELDRFAAEYCEDQVSLLQSDPEAFDFWYITPTVRQWDLDQDILRCFAEARDGSSTGSIAMRASDE